MLAEPSFGQDAPKPIEHGHVVWDVRRAGGKLACRGFAEDPSHEEDGARPVGLGC